MIYCALGSRMDCRLRSLIISSFSDSTLHLSFVAESDRGILWDGLGMQLPALQSIHFGLVASLAHPAIGHAVHEHLRNKTQVRFATSWHIIARWCIISFCFARLIAICNFILHMTCRYVLVKS